MRCVKDWKLPKLAYSCPAQHAKRIPTSPSLRAFLKVMEPLTAPTERQPEDEEVVFAAVALTAVDEKKEYPVLDESEVGNTIEDGRSMVTETDNTNAAAPAAADAQGDQALGNLGQDAVSVGHHELTVGRAHFRGHSRTTPGHTLTA